MKRGRFMEMLVARHQQLLHPAAATVQSPGYVKEVAVGAATRAREFDVLVSNPVAGYTVRTAFEVKDQKRPVDTPLVESFKAKCDACGIDMRILVSASGFTRNAILSARIARVLLRNMRLVEAIPESLIVQVEFLYRHTWVFPEIADPTAFLSCDKTVPYSFMSTDGTLMDLREAVKRARFVHGRLYHQLFLSGRVPVAPATELLEPITIALACPLRLFITEAACSAEILCLNFIHRFDVSILPIAPSLYSYEDPLKQDKPFLFLAGRPIDSKSEPPSFSLAEESDQPISFAGIDDCRPDGAPAEKGDLVFHVPFLGKHLPENNIATICQSLGWQTSLGMDMV